MGYSVSNLLSYFSIIARLSSNGTTDVPFDENYYVTWANNHASILDQGREVQLSLDQSSGAGFVSKQSYISGFFHMMVKLPDKDSTGVITTFYLNSTSGAHSELDIEFLGGRGRPYVLQTNVFANATGNREQRIHLWFDPLSDFHDYQILWNQHQIVFFVDNIPIRVFKNNIKIGVSYPTNPMQIVGSIWQSDWAAGGGNKINWTQAPFEAHYRGFDIQACNSQQCNNSWWNQDKYWELSPDQLKAYQHVRAKYLYYDYCSDKPRYPNPPPECPSNS
ncbi:unnamed protein product [Camellia sinensis]